MSEEPTNKAQPPQASGWAWLPSWNWRIWVGALLTTAWMLGGLIYVVAAGGWSFWDQDAATIGGFLEGFFAPLAFLWLVVGLFIQQAELAETRQEMRHSNALSAQQAEAIEASAHTARQQAVFLIADNVRRQTGNLLGVILANEGRVHESEMARHWAAHAAGDHEYFARLCLMREEALREENWGRMGKGAELFFGTEHHRSLSEEYIRSFRRLLRLAHACDWDDAIRATITQTPHGMVYASLLRFLPAELAWVALLDDPQGLEGPNIDPSGKWDVYVGGYADVECDGTAFHLSLAVEGDDVTGVAESSRGTTPVHDVAVSGRALFLRVEEPQLTLITATIDGDQMQGHIESTQGDTTPFTATRRSNG